MKPSRQNRRGVAAKGGKKSASATVASSGAQPQPGEAPGIFAVIELGSSSVRMAIAQRGKNGALEPLDSLQQTVTLGKDVFATGQIRHETIEQCVAALRNFLTVLREYGAHRTCQVRAVATSALREAANSETVLDRIAIATGLDVEMMDEAEVNRFTFLAVHPAIEARPRSHGQPTLVMEVGGGSTEYLLLRQGEVLASGTFRLGALRLRATVEEPRFPVGRIRDTMLSYVRQAIEPLAGVARPYPSVRILALGGDIRFAASLLRNRQDDRALTKVNVKELAGLADRMLDLSVEETVRKHRLSFPDAETLGPALMAYVEIARLLKQNALWVGQANLRKGILADMAGHDPWSETFKKQILRSARNIGDKYGYDARHADVTAHLCRQLFAALREEHRLDARYELILTVAALLHEIGGFVSNRSHHKHSMYLILNSEIFGLSARDLRLVALVARYHRRALPKSGHELYSVLDRNDRIVVSKLAALLRVADALGRQRRTRRDIRVALRGGRVVVSVKSAEDLTLEEHALREKGPMFQYVYGKELILERI